LSDIIDAVRQLREAVDPCLGFISADDNKETWTYVTGYTYIYFDQYLHTENEFLRVAGFTLLGVFIVTLIFNLSIRSALVIIVIVVFVVFETAGIVALVVKLNGFSVVNLIVSIGLAIELCAHTVHAFLAERGTKKERVIKALEFMAWPMIFGGLTTAITSAFLATSDIPFIRQYYFVMFFCMTIFALANGMVLLPVLLSLPFVGDSSLIGEEQYAKSHEGSSKHSEPAKVKNFGF
jgi:Niemann-Pick C1 protein